jgi:hypothetical protein
MRISFCDHATIALMSLSPQSASNRSMTPADGKASGAPEASAASLRLAAMSDAERLDVLGQLVSMGDWDGVLRSLGAGEDPSKLPPNMGLLWAVARREKMNPDDPGVAAVTGVAVRCAASILNVDESSAIAQMLAKRILRRNPVSWAKQPAPSPWVSAFIMIAALVVGSGIGWILSGGQAFFFLK